jgi:uncharacterized protein YlxP (DUF503 family)
MHIGVLILHLLLPGCRSLKEKRSRLKPLIIRLQREFNVSVAEIEKLDSWHESVIACAVVSNDNGQTNRVLQQILNWVNSSEYDVDLIDESIEIFH